MSQRIDTTGTLLGPYGKEDLEVFWFPETYRKGKRRKKLMRLDYDLVWDITEMQVKLHIRAVPLNSSGPLITQLAKERHFGASEKLYTGESRSKGLKQDIEISNSATSVLHPEPSLFQEVEGRPEASNNFDGPSNNQPVSDQVTQPRHQEDQQGPVKHTFTTPSTATGKPQEIDSAGQVSHLQSLNHDIQFSLPASQELIALFPRSMQASASHNSKMDGRRRAGAYKDLHSTRKLINTGRLLYLQVAQEEMRLYLHIPRNEHHCLLWNMPATWNRLLHDATRRVGRCTTESKAVRVEKPLPIKEKKV